MQWVELSHGGRPVLGPPDGEQRPCVAEERPLLCVSATAVTDWFPFSL